MPLMFSASIIISLSVGYTKGAGSGWFTLGVLLFVLGMIDYFDGDWDQ